MNYYAPNGLTFSVGSFPKQHWPATSLCVGGMRLPTVAELASLLDCTKYPCTPTGIPDMPNAIFMTSDQLMTNFDASGQPYSFMGVDFDIGAVVSVQKSMIAYVLLVQGSLNTTLYFKMADGLHRWGEVPDGGGWHVPTPGELMRLLDYSKYPVTPANHPEVGAGMLWTNAECLAPTLYGQALAVEFTGGRCNQTMKASMLPVMLCKASGSVVVPPPVVNPPPPPPTPPTTGDMISRDHVLFLISDLMSKL